MDQNNRITASFIWTFDDFKARQEALVSNSVKLSNKPSRSSLLVYGLLILAIVGVMVYLPKPTHPSYTTAQNNLPSIVMYLPLIIVLWIVFSFTQKRNLKQSFLNSPDNNKNVLITITSDEIIMKADDLYEIRWSWASLSEVQKTPKGFCFFQTPQAGFWIPIRAFQSISDIETVANLAKSLTPKFSNTAI